MGEEGQLGPPRWLWGTCLAAAVALLASAAALALIHRDDLFETDHVSGVWVGLAWYANHGVLYPPLERHGYYAGTRYMPVLFGLQALLARLTGEYVLSGKMLTAAIMLLLLAGVAAAVGARTGRWWLGVASAGMLLAFTSGLSALLRVRGDALPAALSLWGVLLVGRAGPKAAFNLPAAVLFAAAFLTKFSAVAGLGAALLFLNGWGRRAALALPVVVLVLAGLMATQYASDGRFLANLAATGSGGMDALCVLMAPLRFLGCVFEDPGLVALFPLALLICLGNFRRGAAGLWDYFFVLNVLVLLGIYLSPGTAANHLIELEAACLILVSGNLAECLDARPAGPDRFRRRATPLVIVCVLTAGLFCHVRAWVRSFDGTDYRPEALAAAVPSGARVLSDDANVPVLLGQRPVILDPFGFRLLAERGRIDDRQLAARIRRRHFALVVLRQRIDRPGQKLYPGLHFGPRVTEALRRAYHFDRPIGSYRLFVPNRPD